MDDRIYSLRYMLAGLHAVSRWRLRPRAERYEKLAAAELEHFKYLRPAYIEGPEGLGLIIERRGAWEAYSRRNPEDHAGVRIAVNGQEIPYWGTRVWWGHLWRLMRYSFLAEIHRAMGTVDEVPVERPLRFITTTY